MAFIREELDDTLKQLQEKQSEAKLGQVRVRQQIGQQMSELLNDPRWRTYVQHIDAFKEPHVNRVVTLERILSGATYLSSDDLVKQRFELVKEKTIVDTIDIIKNLVHNLIEQGKATD